MIKKLIIIFISLFCLVGCFNKNYQNDDIERISLDDKYYNKGNFIEISSNDLNNLNGNYIIYTYNSYCSLPVSCEEVFKTFMKKYKIDFLSIPFENFKETKFYGTIKYAPSIIIVEDGNVIDYLDANIDEDLNKYQDSSEFEGWLDKYVYFSKK